MKTVNKISLKVVLMLLLFSLCILCFAGCSKGNYVVGSLNYNFNNYDVNDDGHYDVSIGNLQFEIKPDSRLFKIEYIYEFFDPQGNLLGTKSESRNVNGNSKNNITIFNDYNDLSGYVTTAEIVDIKYYYATEWLYGLIGGIAAGTLLALAIVIFVKAKRKEAGK